MLVGDSGSRDLVSDHVATYGIPPMVAGTCSVSLASAGAGEGARSARSSPTRLHLHRKTPSECGTCNTVKARLWPWL